MIPSDERDCSVVVSCVTSGSGTKSSLLEIKKRHLLDQAARLYYPNPNNKNVRLRINSIDMENPSALAGPGFSV